MTPSTPLTRFEKALHFTLENEDGVRWDHDQGTYTDDPRDPGGATKWGVTLDEYQRYFGGEWTPAMVQAATRGQAVLVYQRYFWNPIQGDKFFAETSSIALFDTAVNKGLGGAKVILTDACHKAFSGEAWVYGPDVVAAVNAMDAQAFLAEMSRATKNYIDARIRRYPNMEWARKGWTNRANRVGALLAWSAT